MMPRPKRIALVCSRRRFVEEARARGTDLRYAHDAIARKPDGTQLIWAGAVDRIRGCIFDEVEMLEWDNRALLEVYDVALSCCRPEVLDAQASAGR